ncbi:MAG: HIT family protein [Candidatus Schekmanbacteria bacterium]|nr:HIT family protein [Candidatus Schekmanbacteria bacterium]
MEECIFCKILKKECPGHFIFEDDSVAGFLDNHPLNRGHTLIVPKKHYDSMIDVPDEVLSQLIVTTKKVGIQVCNALDAAGFNLFQNNGTHAGQVVPHIHFHIIPRFKDDPLRFRPDRKQADAEELSALKEKIIAGNGMGLL